MRTLVVIPAYNEAGSVGEVARSVLAAGWDAVVVDDGSSDATAAEARAAGARVVAHALNRGYGAALATGSAWGIRHGYDAIVHFDADGQHDPGEIAKIVAPIAAGEADAVFGSRFLGAGLRMPAARRLLIKSAILFTWAVSRVRLSDAHNGFRAFSRRALERIVCREDGMSYGSEIVERVAEAGLGWKEIPVTITYSDYSLAKGEGNAAKLRVGLRFLWSKLTH